MALDVTLIGGGMICQDQLLPSLYHLQRLGVVGQISVVGRRVRPLRDLAELPQIKQAFPGQSFRAYPELSSDESARYPELYKQVIAQMPPRNLVMIATPESEHYSMVTCALQQDQHVMVVKPLVLEYRQALEIEQLARSRGLFVGVEYHKRFDRRSLEARRHYRAGRFGEFRLGHAMLIEPWYYRHSNFQNWFTCDITDPFTYVGCHYVDLVWFITGLRPVEVSVRGCKGKFPNGNVGYMWSAARVTFENGGMLNVLNGLGYPDLAAGSNDQGMTLFCEGGDCGGLIQHNDQFRGVAHCYTRGTPPFRFVNPDYFRLVPWEGEGLKPVGYGYDSLEANVRSAIRVNSAGDDLQARQKILQEIDQAGIVATPANSAINEQVIEAGRRSILADGQPVAIGR